MKSSSRLLLGSILVGLATRCLFLALPSTPLRTKAVASIADAQEYWQLGRNLARHQHFSRDTVPPYRPELFRTPVYPLFLAPFFKLFRAPLLPGLLAQLLLALTTVLLSYRLALELGLTETAASSAALLVAISPNLSFITTKLVTETLFGLFLLATLILTNRFRISGRTIDLIGAGIGSGIMVLTRPIATFFPLLLAGDVLVIGLGKRPRRAAVALIPLACAALVVLPWVIRNGQRTGRYIISTAAEHNSYLYNAAAVVAAEKAITISAARDSMLAEAQMQFGTLDTTAEATLWQHLSRVGWHHILRHPLTAARIQLVGFLVNFATPISLQPLLVHSGVNPDQTAPHIAQTVARLLSQGKIGAAFRLVRQERLKNMPRFALVVLGLAALFQLALMVLAGTGLIRARDPALLWLVVVTLYFTLLTGPAADARMRAPIEPLLALCAALGIFRLRKTRK